VESRQVGDIWKMKEEVDKIFEELLQLLKTVIERDVRPCGPDVEERLRTIIYDLAYKAVIEKWTGWNIIFEGVLKAVGQARYFEERYHKSFCYYLKMALEKGWIEHYVLSFREKAR